MILYKIAYEIELSICRFGDQVNEENIKKWKKLQKQSYFYLVEKALYKFLLSLNLDSTKYQTFINGLNKMIKDERTRSL